MTITIPDGVICYDAGIGPKHIRVGMPLFIDDVYVTVTAIIQDPARRQAVVQTVGDEDRETRVHYLAYDETVEAGCVTQYGIDRPGSAYVLPIAVGHGTRARAMAEDSIRDRGGRLMGRTVIPCKDPHVLSGGVPVAPMDEFQPVAGQEMRARRS